MSRHACYYGCPGPRGGEALTATLTATGVDDWDTLWMQWSNKCVSARRYGHQNLLWTLFLTTFNPWVVGSNPTGLTSEVPS
jgi:hypothetical protein